MKKVCMLIIGTAFTLAGFCQTSQPKVEKQIEDPQRKANAGKADVISTNKKNIFDSTTFNNNNNNTQFATNKTSKSSYKKQHCKKRKTKTKAGKAAIK